MSAATKMKLARVLTFLWVLSAADTVRVSRSGMFFTAAQRANDAGTSHLRSFPWQEIIGAWTELAIFFGCIYILLAVARSGAVEAAVLSFCALLLDATIRTGDSGGVAFATTACFGLALAASLLTVLVQAMKVAIRRCTSK